MNAIKTSQRKNLAAHSMHGVAIFFLLCIVAQAVTASAWESPKLRQEQTTAITDNEAAAVFSLETIHGAEATFQATAGNGRYGSLAELAGTNLIDPAWLRIGRSGYWFQLKLTASRRSFLAIARPIKFDETGRRSFSIDQLGVLRFSSQQNANSAQMRLLLDEGRGIAANEASAIALLRTIYSAEATYLATAGNGNFGSLLALSREGLIAPFPLRGRLNGYLFKLLRLEQGTSESPSAFEAVAIPARYGETGIRSFYLDESGVIRAADRKGMAATRQDRPLNR